MKRTNTLYWIFTGLFAAFMIFTSIPDILMSPEAVTFMNHLGYPNYFMPFIGVAKILGSVTILIPGFATLKEWAYAGLSFDLIGAVYSIVALDGLNIGMTFFIIPFGLLILSYRFHHLKMKSI